MGNFLVLLLACLGLFYLIVNNVRTTAQLERLHLFQMVSIAMVVSASGCTSSAIPAR